MIVKIHKTSDRRIILAVCDSNLIGKKFEEKGLQLDLCSDFYKGEEKTEQEICDLFKQAYIVNLVGKESISLALKEEIIEKENIIKIKNVPHAEAVIIRGD
jgi:hypothetical protein